MDVRLKRAYEPAKPADGYRVLIDRLWPRGLSRQRAKLDDWDKTLAPSTSLRRWFGHEPNRFDDFRRRYIEELRSERPRLNALRRGAIWHPPRRICPMFCVRSGWTDAALGAGKATDDQAEDQVQWGWVVRARP